MRIITQNRIVKWVVEEGEELVMGSKFIKIVGRLNVCDAGEFDVEVHEVEKLPSDFAPYLYTYTPSKGFVYRE